MSAQTLNQQFDDFIQTTRRTRQIVVTQATALSEIMRLSNDETAKLLAAAALKKSISISQGAEDVARQSVEVSNA